MPDTDCDAALAAIQQTEGRIRAALNGPFRCTWSLTPEPTVTIDGHVSVTDGRDGLEPVCHSEAGETIENLAVDLLEELVAYAAATTNAVVATLGGATSRIRGAEPREILVALAAHDPLTGCEIDDLVEYIGTLENNRAVDLGFVIDLMAGRLNGRRSDVTPADMDRVATTLIAQLANGADRARLERPMHSALFAGTLSADMFRDAFNAGPTDDAIRNLWHRMSEVHSSVAERCQLHPETIDLIAACHDDDTTAPSVLAHHSSTSEQLQQYVDRAVEIGQFDDLGADRRGPVMCRRVLKHPLVTAEHIEAIWRSGCGGEVLEWSGWSIHYLIAEHANTPGWVLDALSGSRAADVRRIVAANPNTPLPTLMMLATRRKSTVQTAALANPRMAASYGWGDEPRYREWSAAITSEYRGKPERLAAQLNNEQ